MRENKQTTNLSDPESLTRIIAAEKDKTVSTAQFEGPIERFAQKHLHSVDSKVPAATVPVREISFSTSRPEQRRELSESQSRGFVAATIGVPLAAFLGIIGLGLPAAFFLGLALGGITALGDGPHRNRKRDMFMRYGFAYLFPLATAATVLTVGFPLFIAGSFALTPPGFALICGNLLFIAGSVLARGKF